MPAKEKMPEWQFKSMINALCRKWHIPDSSEHICERYWPAFSQLDETGQRAFWQVLGVQEEHGKETVHAVCDDRSPARRH
jgi:hypothetical protein